MFWFGVEISLNVHAESGNTSTSALLILPRDYGIVGLVCSTDRDQLNALLSKNLTSWSGRTQAMEVLLSRHAAFCDLTRPSGFSSFLLTRKVTEQMLLGAGPGPARRIGGSYLCTARAASEVYMRRTQSQRFVIDICMGLSSQFE